MTRTDTVRAAAGAGGLPRPVADTRRRILAAAEARDWAALRRIIGGRPFTYTYGGPQAGGPVGYWQRLERDGERPIAILEAILKMPYTLAQGIYVWPFAYSVPPRDLTPYERRLLAPVADAAQIEKWEQFGGYFFWRAGIAPDGRWMFFVAGD